MSGAADLLDARREEIVHAWTTRLARLPGVPRTSETGLRDHLPELLGELAATLRTGEIPAELKTARAHGAQRKALGFDLELLVREYGLLREVIFDRLESEGMTPSFAEIRIIGGLLTQASAQGVEVYIHRERGERLSAVTRAQQEQLSEVLDALPVLVSFVTAEERYALVNKAYEEWFGLPREQLVGRTVLELIGEAAYERLGPFVRRALAGEQFDFEQYDIPYRHGGTRDIRVSFVPRHDSPGTVSGYVALLTDITSARRNAEERERLLHAERDAHARTDFLLSVAAAIGEGLHAHAVMQRLVEVIVPSRGNAASVWARRPDGTLVRQVHAPFHEALLTESSSAKIALPFTRVATSGETLLVGDLDSWAEAEGTQDALAIAQVVGARAALFLPIRIGSQVVAVLAVSRAEADAFSKDDVELFETTTRLASIALENARLFEETERLRTAAEEATADKDRFLAHVSHDLRNPLGSILGWAALLRSSTNLKQIERGVEVIERNAKAQVQLIDDLLDMSRIATGKLALHVSLQDVRAAIDTALDPARIAAQTKGITLTAVVADDVGMVTVDPDRFRQVVWNLVSNAVKFTPAGGTVRVTVSRDESLLRVVVTDTGQGIAPEFLARIFDRFEQASADARRTGGLGLGLAIVRHLVELHGGAIAVTSVLGQGATFTATFPTHTPEEPDAPLPSNRSASRLRDVRLLVVDDQEDLRDLLGAVLEAAGATVVTAASADEAMSSFLSQRPDVLISDIGMPIKDGRSLIREIRLLAIKRGGQVPALALTAFGQPHDRALSLAAGFDDLLSKPVDSDHLIETIARLIQSRKG